MTTLKTLAAGLLVGLLGLAGPAAAETTKEGKAKKPRLAILSFPTASGAWSCSGWAGNEGRMSDVLRELFTTEISEKSRGKLRLVERAKLSELREELKFQQSGEVDPASAQSAGKLLGARYVLTGKITRFACKVSGMSTGWGVGALVGKVTGDSLAGDVAGSVNVNVEPCPGPGDHAAARVRRGQRGDPLAG